MRFRFIKIVMFINMYAVASVMFMNMCTVASAFADEKMGRFFLEPEVGYALAGALGSPADSFSGFDVGGRLGVNLGKLMIGGSVKYLPSVSYISNGTTTALSPSPTLLNYGAFLGLNLGRLRLWGGYNFSDAINNFSFVGETFGVTGTSFFGGLGYRIGSMLSLNAEVIFPSYTKETGSADGLIPAGALSPTQSGHYLVLSLSLPLRF
jgi:hypothetical protein